MVRAALFTTIAWLGAALPVHAEILRCTAPDGRVSYQQTACATSEAARVVAVPESYPAADPAQRVQLFEREAALDRRLEARRERETREAIARAAQPPPAQAQVAEPQPVWMLAPLARAHRHPSAHSRGIARFLRRD